MRISDWSSDVCSSDLSLLWISVADGFFAAELSHAGKLKMGGSACGNPRTKAGFLLARISGDAQLVSVRQHRPQETARVDAAIWTGGGGSCHRPFEPIGRSARSAWGRVRSEGDTSELLT